MRLLLDTNVLLDVLLAREPWAGDAARLLAAIDQGRATGFTASHAITTAHYVIERAHGRTAAAMGISDLLRILDVVPVERADLQQALTLGLPDYEDAVLAVCALRAEADAIVTRDRGFEGFSIPSLLPGAILPRLA